MAASHGARLLALRCDTLAGLASDAIVDVIDYFDPDLIYIVRKNMDMRVVSRLQRECDSSVIHARGNTTVQTETINGVSIAFARSADIISSATTATGETIPDTAAYVVCDELQMNPDTVAMETTLDGLDDIARYQAHTNGETTFLTGALEASYDYIWHAEINGTAVRLPIRGLAPLRRSGSPELACLTCNTDGRVAITSAPADKFGLQALFEVGPTMAQRLTDNGYTTRADVAAATEQELQAIHGIGNSTARTMHQSACALAEEGVVRPTDTTVPAVDYPPLFIDIETDGLSPTIIWLIGVYDPECDEYIDFIDTELSRDEPGTATRSFITWLAAEYDRPSLITWNGYNFDYKHLTRFIAGHAPEFREYWDESVFTYDLYDWAVTNSNAVLPGRTNRLEDVAAGLGCDRAAAGSAVDGKTLARTIQRLLQSPDRASEMDWDAARAYCEADVRELAGVYAAIAGATPERETTETPTDKTTSQTKLLDF